MSTNGPIPSCEVCGLLATAAPLAEHGEGVWFCGDHEAIAHDVLLGPDSLYMDDLRESTEQAQG